jgi:uncharacterized protein (TIGR02246 family)
VTGREETQLAAELDVHNLIVSAWAAIDRKDWDTYANAFADDGEFEIMGQRRRGRSEIVTGPARDLAKFDVLQHIVSNIAVHVNGDHADGQWYAIAVHVPDSRATARHADTGLRYRFRASRLSDGWRFNEVLLEVLWTSGIAFDIDRSEDP